MCATTSTSLMKEPGAPPKIGALESGVAYLSVALSSCFFTSFVPAKFVSSFRIKIGNKSLTEEKWTGAGLVGSLWGLATHLFLPLTFISSGTALSLGVLSAILFSHIAERSLGVHDDPRIVIDEWIGAWIALWTLPQSLTTEVFLAFLLFRLFDVLKGPWGRALQRLPGGFGVVLDDVMAGILANIVVRLLAHI
jgi:phosphatidylglycerophosphatase A